MLLISVTTKLLHDNVRLRFIDMTTSRQRSYLLHVNRLVIYLVSLIGLLWDVNIAYIVALTLWIWLPQCLQLELAVIKSLKQHVLSIERRSH
ncbi:hypothetical protein [Litorilituus lipolyticus]|nr:hypothetical protein [Litorilituus lipolyticus]